MAVAEILVLEVVIVVFVVGVLGVVQLYIPGVTVASPGIVNTTRLSDPPPAFQLTPVTANSYREYGSNI